LDTPSLIYAGQKLRGCESPRGPRVDQLACVFCRKALSPQSLSAGDLDSGEKLDLARNFHQRRVLRQLGDKIDDQLSIAHGLNGRWEPGRR
jgi:hypothetical protein